MNTTYDSCMNTRKRNQHHDDLKDSATAITHWCKCQRYCVSDQGVFVNARSHILTGLNNHYIAQRVKKGS